MSPSTSFLSLETSFTASLRIVTLDRPPLELPETLPCGQERLLQDLLGVVEGAQHSVAVRSKLPAVRLGQILERVAVPSPRLRDQFLCVGRSGLSHAWGHCRLPRPTLASVAALGER